MAHLLLISIGPVQDFIAASRRGRDLWFSSWLSSELSKAAAAALANQEGLNALIFPAVKKTADLEQNSEFNCVNKLLVRVDADPTPLMEKARGAIRARLFSLWKRVLDDMDNQKHLQVQSAENQLEDFVELAWVALPFAHEADYPQIRQQLEMLLQARKTLREFGQVSWGAPVPKSALDGLRESVIHEDAYKKRPGESPQDKEKRDRRLYECFGVSSGERLCAVGLLKRLGRPDDWRDDEDEQHRAPSTYHIAAMPFMQELAKNPRATKGIAAYVQFLRDKGAEAGCSKRQLNGDIGHPPGNTGHPIPYQGQILYPSRLQALLGSADAAEAAAKQLRSILRKVSGGQEPSPYYALLLADGDNMGKGVDAQKTPELHRQLSLKLSAFAASVRGILEPEENPRGRLLYAGGDDILSFVSLNHLLTVIEDLAEKFQEALKDHANQEFKPSLSFGVIIAHQLDPLSSVLERLREAEKKAKALKGKGAVAITLSKRGGADVTVVDHTKQLLARLAYFAGLHQQDALSDRTAYQLRDAALRHQEPVGGFPLPSDPTPDGIPLEPTKVEEARLARKALAYDALRVLTRKRAERGARSIDDTTRGKLEALLLLPEDIPAYDAARKQRTLDPLTDPQLPRGERPLSVRALADELIVARILAQANTPLGAATSTEEPLESTPTALEETLS